MMYRWHLLLSIFQSMALLARFYSCELPTFIHIQPLVCIFVQINSFLAGKTFFDSVAVSMDHICFESKLCFFSEVISSQFHLSLVKLLEINVCGEEGKHYTAKSIRTYTVLLYTSGCGSNEEKSQRCSTAYNDIKVKVSSDRTWSDFLNAAWFHSPRRDTSGKNGCKFPLSSQLWGQRHVHTSWKCWKCSLPSRLFINVPQKHTKGKQKALELLISVSVWAVTWTRSHSQIGRKSLQ